MSTFSRNQNTKKKLLRVPISFSSGNTAVKRPLSETVLSGDLVGWIPRDPASDWYVVHTHS